MRFLYCMLTLIWIAFAWVSFQALNWEGPYQTPRYLLMRLEHTSPEELNEHIQKLKTIITMDSLPVMERAHAEYLIADCYWMKTFLSTLRPQQDAYLKYAIDHCEKAIQYKPDGVSYLLLRGRIHELQGNPDDAESFYNRALHFARAEDPPDDRMVEIIEHRLRRIAENRTTF